MSSIWRLQSQPFFIVILHWSASLWLVLNHPSFDHSFPLRSFCRVDLELTMEHVFVVFCSSFFPLMSLSWIVDDGFVGKLKIRTANIYMTPIESLFLILKGARVAHETQICHLSLTLIWIWICHFSWVIFCVYTRPSGWSSFLCSFLKCDLLLFQERRHFSGLP